MKEIGLIEKAARIMASAHEGQKRKSDDSLYIIHPIMVALRLEKYGFPDFVIAAALVHDVLEDTDFSAQTLRQELGGEVFEIVKTVSEDKSLEWEERKQKYIESVRSASESVKAVSIGDKIHNLESLLAGHAQIGLDIWKKFNRGKEQKIWFEKECLRMFKETWQHPLVLEYEKLLAQLEQLE